MPVDKNKRKPRRPPAGAVIGVLVAVFGGGIWWLSQNIAGVTRGEAPVPTVNLLPPPPPTPPPPPPPPEKPPDPDKTIEPPKPSDQPKADEPKQLTIAGPAQAGGDAFGVKAGSGGGTSLGGGPNGTGGAGTGGGGFADAAYSRFLGTELQRAVEADSRLNTRVFNADVGVWVDAGGHLTRAKIYRSSGDASLDQKLIDAIENVRSLGDAPPASLRFPLHIAVRSRRA